MELKIPRRGLFVLLLVAIIGIGGLTYAFLKMGIISADTDSQALGFELKEARCVAGKNYKIKRISDEDHPDTVGLTGAYTTLGSETKSHLEKVQGLPVDYRFHLNWAAPWHSYALDTQANFAAFFANGLLEEQSLPEDIFVRFYNSKGFYKAIKLGKFLYNPNVTEDMLWIPDYLRFEFDRVDFVRVSPDDKAVDLMISCSRPGVPQATVGASKYKEPTVSVDEYHKAFDLSECTLGDGWEEQGWRYEALFEKTYTPLGSVDQQQFVLAKKLTGHRFGIALDTFSGTKERHPGMSYSKTYPKTTFGATYYLMSDMTDYPVIVSSNPMCSKIMTGLDVDKSYSLPEKVRAVFSLRNGQKREQFTKQVTTGCVEHYDENYYGIDVEWKDVVGVDFYRVSTTDPSSKEKIASCVRPTVTASPASSATATVSASPQASPSPTASKSASPKICPSPSRSPSLTPSPSPTASKSTAASSRSVTSTPSRTSSPKRSATPVVSPAPSKRVWQPATVVGTYIKSSWKAISKWYNSFWGK